MQHKNNLADASQPWARDIVKQLAELNKKVESTGAITKSATSFIEGTHEQVIRTADRITTIEVHGNDVDRILEEANRELIELNEVILPAMRQEIEDAVEIVDDLNDNVLPGIVSDLETVQGDLVDVNDEIDSIEGTLAGVQGDLVDVNAELDVMEQAIGDVQGDLVDVQDVVDTANQNAQDAIDAALAAETTASGANARMVAEAATVSYRWTGTVGASASEMVDENDMVIATNYALNPSFEYFGTTAWSLLNCGNFSRTVAFPLMWASSYGGRHGNYIAGVESNGTSNTMRFMAGGGSSDYFILTNDNYVAASALVASEYSMQARLTIDFYDSDGLYITGWGSSSLYQPTDFYAGALLRHVVEVPPEAYRCRVAIQWRRNDNATIPSGARGWADAMIVTQGATEEAALGQTMEYFDGDSEEQVVAVEYPSTRRNGADLVQGDELMLVDSEGRWLGVRVWNGSHWVPSQIVADSLLVPGSAGSTVIADGAITTPKLVAGSVVGEKVAAHTLTADKLVIGNGTNLIPNGGLTHDNIFTNNSGWDYLPNGRGEGRGVIRYTVQGSSRRTGYFPITPGMQYRFTMEARASLANSVFYVQLVHTGSSGNPYMFSNQPLTTGWQTFTNVFTAPADMSSVEMVLYGNHSNGVQGGTQEFANFRLQTMTGTTLIEEGAITTGKLVAGAVIGDKVAANTLTASKLVIGNADNLLPDPDMVRPSIWGTTSTGVTIGTGGYNGKRRINIPVSSVQSGMYTGGRITEDEQEGLSPISPGESYYVEAWVRGGSQILAGSSRVAIYGRFHETKESAPITTSLIAFPDANIPGGTWAKVSGIFTAPANAMYMAVGLFKNAGQTSGVVWWSAPVLRKAVGTTLIEDGAITTDKIIANAVNADKIATNAVVADKIAANAVTTAKIDALAVNAGKIAANAVTTAKINALAVNAGKIATNAVTADKILANAITAGKIATNAVTADNIAANAIDAKHTITGALIRSSTGVNRTQMNNSGIQVFSNNVEQVRIGYGIASGMSVRNPSSGSLVPLAPMVLGSSVYSYTSTWALLPNNSSAYSPWKYSNALGSTVSSPTGRFMFLATVSGDFTGNRNMLTYYLRVGLSTSSGNANGSTPPAGVTWMSGSDAITFESLNSPAAMGVLTLNPNQSYYLRIAGRSFMSYHTSSVTGALTGWNIFIMPY